MVFIMINRKGFQAFLQKMFNDLENGN